MVSLYALFALVCAASSLIVLADPVIRETEYGMPGEFIVFGSTQTDFAAWCQKHDRVYASEEEQELRFSVWRDTIARINHRNANPAQFTFHSAPNKFSDLTEAEFAERQTTRPRLGASVHTSRPGFPNDQCAQFSDLYALPKGTGGADGASATLPPLVDWRKKGAVTPVSDQVCRKTGEPCALPLTPLAWRVAAYVSTPFCTL
jgi:hypothetical protein